MNNINYEFLKNIYETEKQPPPQPKKKKKKIRWGLIVFSIFMIIFSTFLGFGLAIMSRALLFESVLALLPGEKLLPKTNILVLGLDKGRNIHRSDSIMIVHLDPNINEASILSIPRDTIAAIPGRGLDKINHSFAYGGPELTRKTVQNLLKIKIPYYITINIGGLEKIIDEVGGVNLNVEKRMYYVDYAQNLFVNLKPGKQNLSGRDSLSYIRFRHDRDGDIGRIYRQQKFTKALTQKMFKGDNLMRSPQLVLKLLSYLETNLSARETLGFTLAIKKIYEFGQIRMDSLGGDPIMLDGVFYIKPKEKEIQQMVKTYFEKIK